MFSEKRIVWLWRVGLFFAGLGIVGWILWHYFGVDGAFTLSYQFEERNSYISKFSPIGRALEREQNLVNGEHYQRIISDPVYFSVDLPSAYPTIDVTLEYQNPAQKIVELGLRLSDQDDTTTIPYTFAPLENKFVDASNWDRVENDEYVLLQVNPIYTSVEDFLNNPPDQAKVGTYLTDFALPFVDPAYQPSDRTIDITVPLRGRHNLYTYIKKEPLHFTFTYEDINYAAGDDTWTLEVKRLGEVIATQTLTDDGVIGVTSQSNGSHTAQVDLPDLDEGVYEVVLNAGDDIMFTRIQSSQDHLVFNKSIHLAGSSEYHQTIPALVTNPTTLYSDSSILTATAKHYAGIQDLQFYNTTLAIARTDVPFVWENPVPGYFYEVTFPTNDVYVTNDTAFALDRDQWFDPWFGFRNLNQYTDEEQLEYIISKRYTEPTRVRGWVTATTTFDLTQAHRSDPTNIDFMLSAPGLYSANGGLKVRKITITAHKEPITWSNLWQRLSQKLF